MIGEISREIKRTIGLFAEDGDKIKTFDVKEKLKTIGFEWSPNEDGNKGWLFKSFDEKEVWEKAKEIMKIGLLSPVYGLEIVMEDHPTAKKGEEYSFWKKARRLNSKFPELERLHAKIIQINDEI